MIYQRHIPDHELFSAQLEMLLQNVRIASVGSNLLGIVAAVILFWQFVDHTQLLLWAAGFTILLLGRALYMSNVLVERRFESRPRQVYSLLLLGTLLSGGVWAAAYVLLDVLGVPDALLFLMLVLICLVTALSMGVTLALREYFLVHLFASLWPIAWWTLAHYGARPYNLLLGLLTLAACVVLIAGGNRLYLSLRNLIAINWEREAMARELGDLTRSLRDRNRQLRDARAQLTDLANVDELTGLGNRRLVNKALHEELNRARRNEAHLAVIMLDVDYFKPYNDTHGHPAGDVVLQRLADLMQRATSRAGEVVGRYGGEEFILILPGADEASALRTARRLRELVLAEQIPHGESRVSPWITLSQGVVSVRPDGTLEPEDLVKMADEALYEAKYQGRDRVVAYRG